MSAFRKLANVAGIALVVAAIVTEHRRPATERTGQGTVAGIVPYDFRLPTLDRVRATFWRPGGPLFVPTLIGVGWTINAGALARRLRLA